MTRFEWTVVDMSVVPEIGDFRDVIFSVGVRCTGLNESGSSHFEIYCGIDLNSDGNFTPYSQITEQQVLDWAWKSGVDKAHIESYVEKSLSNVSTESGSSFVLPWEATIALEV